MSSSHSCRETLLLATLVLGLVTPSLFGQQAPRRAYRPFEAASAASGAPTMQTFAPPPAATADWPHVRAYGPFIFRGDASLHDIEPLLAEIRDIHGDLRQYLGLPSVTERVEVYVLSDKQTYRRLLARWFPGAPPRRALYIKQGGPGVVLAYRHAEWEEDLRHECTHAILHASLAMVPLWLDEGLAEYFEVPESERSTDNPHLTRVRLAARLGVAADLARLESIADVQDAGSDEYRAAWAWVHFLLHGDRLANRQLVAWIASIARREPPGRFSARLEASVPDYEERFVRHFRTWRAPQ